jgi:hypothetical protein
MNNATNLIKDMKWRLSDFWTQTLSCTLGTVIGIVLTFGTSAWIEYREKQETERTAALMVIHNLNNFIEGLDETVSYLQATDSINMRVMDAKDRLNTVSEDTLQMFVSGILNQHFSTHDETAETIFSSNIETWKSIDNREFIELAGDCFSAKRLMIKFQERLEAEKYDLTDLFLKTVYFADRQGVSTQESAAMILRSATYCSYIKRQHDFYLKGLEQGLHVLREQTGKCKRLMNVTDDELQQFSYNE